MRLLQLRTQHSQTWKRSGRQWFILRLWLLAVITCSTLLYCDTVHAQSLVILDCQGITRAIHETRGAQLNRVEIEVSDPQSVPNQGKEVKLVNNATGQEFTAPVNSGKVVFEQVPLGNYSIVATGSTLNVGVITIGASQLGVLASGGIAGGGLLAAGGGVAGGVAVVENISGSKEATPTPQPSATPTPQGTRVPEATPPPVLPTPTPTICDCDPDAEPTPLSPFRDPEAALLSPYR